MASNIDPALGNVFIERSKKFRGCLNNNDFDGLKSMYSSDAILMPPGHKIIVGNEDITEYYRSLKREGAAHSTVAMLEWNSIGPDLVFERGCFTAYTGDGVPIDVGKYLTIWKNADGEWKAYIDIANSNSRMPTI